MRIKTQELSYLRALEGYELMALAGWPRDGWTTDEPLPDRPTCTSLAGNAFSAFAIGPMLIASIAALGIPLLPQAKTPESDKSRESSPEGDGSDSD